VKRIAITTAWITQSALALTASLILGLNACAPAETDAGPPNVILLCLDTVRADHLGCYGYDARPTTPALDDLAGRSTVYLDTSAASGWTKPSVPSFMTGTYPAQHGVYQGSSSGPAGLGSDILPEASVTIAEAFQAAGYATGGFVRNAQLRPGQGIEQGFDTYQDRAGDAREIRWRGLDWLDELAARGDRQRGRPFFLYLHYLDAHWPYPVPDEYATRFTDAETIALFRGDDWKKLRDRVNHGETELSAEQIAGLVALYDGSLRYIDDQFALLLRGLKERGLGDNTIICVVSDHGEEFMEHGRIGHGHGLYENLLQVPWILHVPGREARRITEPASLVDLFPTLLAAAGLPPSPTAEGNDRFTYPAMSSDVFAEHLDGGRYLQAGRVGSHKIERTFKPVDGGDRKTGQIADASELTHTVITGTRWEARLAASGDTLSVIELKPDGDATDATELKGLITEIKKNHLRINGLAVELLAEAELYGDTHTADGQPVSLARGLGVKAKGHFEDGVLRCHKLKLYADGKSLTPALRGVVTDKDEGTLTIGPHRLTLASDCLLDGRGTARMDRNIASSLLGQAREAAAPPGFTSEARTFDLRADPDEMSPVSGASSLEAWLDAKGSHLGTRVFWGTNDRSHLSSEDLDRLRAIGYAH
jgi:arylsulfatase A-like enzyme